MRARPGFLLRVAVYGLFAGLAITSLLVACGVVELDTHEARRISLAASGSCAATFVAVALLIRPRRARWLRILDIVAANVVATLVLAELAAVGWTRWFPSPLAWDDSDAEAAIRANRLPPGSSYFGFRVNSHGCHDDEFFVADEDDVVVALLADSFGVGVVPHAFLFATIAERRLAAALGGDTHGRRVAVHNFGVSSIGPAQYVLLADREVPRYRPQAVVVCLFVGNDITQDTARVRGSRLRAFQGWVSFQLAERILRLARAADTVDRLAAIGRTAASAAEVPAWVNDPSLEVATFTAEQYLQIESERAEVTHEQARDTERGFRRLWTALDYLGSRFGDRLGIVLIPDEFQVDDALWREVMANKYDPARYSRLRPQERIVAHCARRGIAVLDLTPAFLAAANTGTVRLYHQRDTHWNAAGNRLAGEAIAQWLLRRLR